jgi:hypothetical protein
MTAAVIGNHRGEAATYAMPGLWPINALRVDRSEDGRLSMPASNLHDAMLARAPRIGRKI